MKEIIITSSALILCVMVIRHFFKGKISNRLQYALWILVAVRLMIPVPAQVRLSLGIMNEFRVMSLAERLETRFGDITGRLQQPVSFAINMDSPVGSRMAEYILGEDMQDIETADGPTSIFLAGKTGLTWLNILHGIWFGGMAAVAVWMTAVNLRFRHKLRGERHEFLIPEKTEDKLDSRVSGYFCKRSTDPESQSVGQEKKRGKTCRRGIHSRRQIKVYTVEHLMSPCLYGFPGREAIYLPENVVEDEDRLRHVLTHEVCHKRHGDGFWSVLRNILLICYWFHPLVWAAAVLSRRDCELACDESALLLLGEEERIGYGKTLLSIITGRGRLSDFACTATTMTGTGKSIKERIRYIAEKPKILGAAVAAVLILITVASVLVFTRSPQFSGGTWDGGTIYVMTGDKQIMLPDTIAGISGYAEVEGKQDDLIIYQTASDQEVGRFCTLTYEEAVALVDAGRPVVLLGSYGQNGRLSQYMGLSHIYTSEESITEHHYAAPEPSGKDPFAFDGKTEWEEFSFAFDGQTEWANQEQPERVTENLENGVPGTDSNTDESIYIIEDEAAGSDSAASEESTDYLPEEAAGAAEYLPDEQITTVFSYNPYMMNCYLYVTADYSRVKDKDLEQMRYIDSELKAAARQVVVTGINREITEETFGTLAAHKTQYLGDNSEVLALVNALPQPEGLFYQSIELTTGAENRSLQVNYHLDPDGLGYIDHDVLFFDAVMLFATIENLDECIFRIGEGSTAENVIYSRTESTEQAGVEELWKDLEGEALQSWLEELHQSVVLNLSGR